MFVFGLCYKYILYLVFSCLMPPVARSFVFVVPVVFEICISQWGRTRSPRCRERAEIEALKARVAKARVPPHARVTCAAVPMFRCGGVGAC